MKKKMVCKCNNRHKACCHPGVDVTAVLASMLFLYAFLFQIAANILV